RLMSARNLRRADLPSQLGHQSWTFWPPAAMVPAAGRPLLFFAVESGITPALCVPRKHLGPIGTAFRSASESHDGNFCSFKLVGDGRSGDRRPLRVGALLCRALLPTQIERAVDQTDVTVGLWKIAQHAAAQWIEFLRQQADVIAA